MVTRTLRTASHRHKQSGRIRWIFSVSIRFNMQLFKPIRSIPARYPLVPDVAWRSDPLEFFCVARKGTFPCRMRSKGRQIRDQRPNIAYGASILLQLFICYCTRLQTIAVPFPYNLYGDIREVKFDGYLENYLAKFSRTKFTQRV